LSTYTDDLASGMFEQVVGAVAVATPMGAVQLTHW
jgi:hypothetical protein